MGFSFKRFDYVGDSGSWGGNNAGTSTTAQRNRAEVVLKDFGDYIISCNRGWQLDQRCATTSSFFEIPVESYSSATLQSFKAIALFFENTTSGYKLMLGICPYSSTYRIKSFNNTWSHSGSGISGIFLSITDGADFGLDFDNGFLPTTSTYITGTLNYFSNGYTYYTSYISCSSSGYNYVYGLFIDEYCIGVGGGFSSNTTPICRPCLFVGRILGTLANSENLSVSKLGSFRLTDSNNTASNLEFSVSLINYYNNTNYSEININTTASIAMVFNSTGTKICNEYPVNNSAATVRLKGYDVILSNYVCNSEILDAVAWTPFKVIISSSDLESCGVIPGFGFKGYLDTNLFRYAYCTTNKLYDSGHFIGHSDFDLLIGWDSNNTDNL